MGDIIQETREKLCEFAYDLYVRHITDTAGGNLSVRIDDKILMTPRYGGNLYHWRLRPEQILILDLKGNKVEGEGDVSREAKVHLALLNEFYPEATAVIHAHARNVLVFCAAEKPLPPVLYATSKFGVIPQIPDAASGTDELAINVREGIRSQGGVTKKVQAAAVMAPRHGLFVLGRTLADAFDVAERIDTNAYCLLAGQALGEITPFLQPAKVNPNYDA